MSDSNDGDAEYPVGKGRPPLQHRFKKGVSGNPSGEKRNKPKSKRKPRNLRAEVIDELEQRVVVSQRGRRRQIPQKAAFAKQLVADALSGNAKARDQLIKLVSQSDAYDEVEEAESPIGAAKDAEILERFRAEIIAKYKAEENG